MDARSVLSNRGECPVIPWQREGHGKGNLGEGPKAEELRQPVVFGEGRNYEPVGHNRTGSPVREPCERSIGHHPLWWGLRRKGSTRNWRKTDLTG